MLSGEAARAIQAYVTNECGELNDLREKIGAFKRSVFSEIHKIQNEELSEKPQFLYDFATVNLELSNSIKEITRAGYLLAAHGLLRWQLVLWQKAFVMYNDDETFDRWKRGKQIKEADLRKYIADFYVTGPGSSATEVLGRVPQLETDWVNFTNLSQMLHLHYDMLPSMLPLSNLKHATDHIKHLARRMLFQDIENTARFMMVALHCLSDLRESHITTTDPLSKTVDEFETMIFDLRKKYAAYEREHGLLEDS